MPINSTKLGPGSLTLGAGAMEVNAQLTACNVTPAEAVEETDPIRVLSGELLDGSSTQTYSFTLGGSFLQDLGAVASVVDWSWTNMGTEQPFVFVPNTAAGREVSGVLIPVPLTIGGEDPEGAPLQSDFTWRIVGTPDWQDVTP
jgi:hypothetical protein